MNVFRMLGQMGGDRLAVQSTSAERIEVIRDDGVRQKPDVYALATRNERDVAVMVWNYHDDDLPAAPADVELTIEGLAAGRPTLTHYRVDRDHGNAYEAWKKMGSPPQPTPGQYTQLEEAGKLQLLRAPEPVDVQKGTVRLSFSLPRQGVSLLRIVY